jgi:HK97 family phage major capsid protein
MTKADLEKLMQETATSIAAGLIDSKVAAQLKVITDKQAELERKSIFQSSEGSPKDGEFKTADGSVLNTTGFFKSMMQIGGLEGKGLNVSNGQLANIVLSNGGIFTKLSPAMEHFARMLKGKMNADKMANLGFKREEYMAQVATQVKQTGMNEGVGADGGFTVPVEYASTVIEFAILMSDILKKVQRVSMKSNSAKWPRLAQTDESFFGGFCFHWLDEGERKVPSKIAFEQVTFTAHKVASVCVLTDELVQDSLINIINYITALGARAWMYEMERCVIDGSGVGQPLGFTNDPVVIANAVPRTTLNTLDWRDFINLEQAMNENFRDLAFVLRRKAVSTARLQMDTTNHPIWDEGWGVHNGTPNMTPTIIGYPYHVTRNAKHVGHQGDVTLCDLSYYMLAIRKDMTIDISPYPYWLTDETAIRFVARIDGKCGTPYAFKLLKGAGS